MWRSGVSAADVVQGSRRSRAWPAVQSNGRRCDDRDATTPYDFWQSGLYACDGPSACTAFEPKRSLRPSDSRSSRTRSARGRASASGVGRPRACLVTVRIDRYRKRRWRPVRTLTANSTGIFQAAPKEVADGEAPRLSGGESSLPWPEAPGCRGRRATPGRSALDYSRRPLGSTGALRLSAGRSQPRPLRRPGGRGTDARLRGAPAPRAAARAHDAGHLPRGLDIPHARQRSAARGARPLLRLQWSQDEQRVRFFTDSPKPETLWERAARARPQSLVVDPPSLAPGSRHRESCSAAGSSRTSSRSSGGRSLPTS